MAEETLSKIIQQTMRQTFTPFWLSYRMLCSDVLRHYNFDKTFATENNK